MSLSFIPMLLVSLAGMISGVLMPYLSADWESGRRVAVGVRDPVDAAADQRVVEGAVGSDRQRDDLISAARDLGRSP